MTTTTMDTSQKVHKAPMSNGLQIESVIDAILPQYDAMIKSYVVFNAFFLSLGILEFVLLVTFFTFLAQSAVLATSLALVFLTFFSYFILRLYLQAKQPEQLLEVKERFVQACKGLINYNEGTPENYVALAAACTRFADCLQHKQETSYSLPAWLDAFKPTILKFCAWCQGHDVRQMQEMLLLASVDENIKLVKCAPTSLAAHAALANAYLALSSFYQRMIVKESSDEEELITNDAAAEAGRKKFKSAAERAIAEFKIINEFSPADPWAHLQLASIYRDLKLPHDEIREYETILRLTPNDNDALFRIGKLYFQQGWNGHGLRIFEQLRQQQDKRADELIQFYGTLEA